MHLKNFSNFPRIHPLSAMLPEYIILSVMLIATSTIRALQLVDLEMLGVEPCPQKNSCPQIGQSPFVDRNCECDSHCNFYHDCCVDSPWRTSGRSQVSTSASRHTCLSYGNFSHLGAYVISSCPRNFVGPAEVRQQCQRNNFSDPILSIPVTDASTGKTFLNRYCALCNYASERSPLKTWLIMACKVYERQRSSDISWNDIVFRQDLNQWGVMSRNGEFEACAFRFDKPVEVGSQLRSCWSNLVSSCPRSWRQQQFVRACDSYQSAVSAGGRTFRNPHCAICNGIRAEDVECLNPSISERKSKPFSFALLLDVNRSDGDIVGVSRQCPSGQKYDPFFKKCRNLVCALPGYSMVNGRCMAQ